MKNILEIFLLLLFQIHIISSENDIKDSLDTYDKLNKFETISQHQDFIINTAQKSKAYFDSFDNNAIFWISKNYDDYNNHTDEKITGKFYTIEPNTTYYIRNFIYFSTMVIKKYLYPLNLNENEIIINDTNEEINFLYLEKDKIYTLNFKENTIKKILKLSHKTLNSKIKIKIDEKEETELNQDNHYYLIKENFNGKIILEIKENDAFIEFLSDFGDYQILEDKSYENEIDKDIIIIKIKKTQKKFRLELTSNEPFNCSLSYGFSNLINYYYYSQNNPKIASEFNEESNYTIYKELVGSFKDINLSQDEFLSFSINIERKKDQKIILKYYQYTPIDKLYDEEISEENCTKIIENLKEVLEIYVYSDIAQNPPNINNYPNYHHKAINLKQELDKISKINRTFYEFYQDIQKVLTSTRDLHFNIYAHETPKGIPFGQYAVALPFDFEVRKDKNDQYRIFIKKNTFYDKMDIDYQKFFDARLDIPLRKINDIDPFDYIQNWSKYRQTKNPHAEFSYIINGPISYFYLCNFPVEYSELYNEYEFDDNSFAKFWHLDNFNSFKENNEEFNNYFINLFKSQKSPFQLPHIDIIHDEFLISKGLKQRKKILKEEKIKWDILYEEEISGSNKKNYLKCRVDEENKVNVLIQNSFNLNFYNASAKAFDCARLFYTNEYPLIIIQDHNGGGSANLLLLMHQIFQIRTTDRSYESFRLSNISKEYFGSQKWNFVDIETCDIGKSFNDIKNITDHYEYNNLNIEHIRTKVVDRFPREFRNALDNFREEYINSSNIKKPTDIIIFTDSYSYSATSGFIKGFQSTGGAIIVGYYGNPIKNETEFFDSSQSDSDVQNLKNTEIYKNLNSLGITIVGVTCGESYDDFYQKENPIPREYTLDPVDYRVDIYSSYSDELYDKFIKEGLEVYNLFNNGSYCNSRNDKLLLHNDSCYTIEEKEYAHGGYKCNDNNKWDIEGECHPYYCDIGYYYDQFNKTCRKECPYDNNTKYFFIHEKNMNKIYNIYQGLTYKFHILPNEGYYYSFETNEETMGNSPKLFIGTVNRLYTISNIKNEVLPVKIKAINSSLNTDLQFAIYYVQSLNINYNIFMKRKYMFFLQSLDDSNFFIHNYLNIPKFEWKILKYNSSIESEDIIKANDKYFLDIYNDEVINLEKNQLYIIYLNFKDFGEINFYFTKIKSKLIKMTEYGNKNIIFLEKNKNYTLDFNGYNKTNILIKLTRRILNTEIIILNENIKLDSTNSYYILKQNFNGTLDIQLGNKNAIIEILVKQDDNNLYEIIDIEGKTKLYLNKKYNYIQIPKKNYDLKELTFTLNKEGNSVIFIYHDYSLPGYSLDFILDNADNQIQLNNFSIEINNHYKDYKSLENEYYYLIIQTNQNDLNISVNIEIKDIEPKNEDEDDNGLKAWEIILIVIGSIIFVALIILLIICCKKRNKLTNEEIEQKTQSLTQVE